VTNYNFRQSCNHLVSYSYLCEAANVWPRSMKVNAIEVDEKLMRETPDWTDTIPGRTDIILVHWVSPGGAWTNAARFVLHCSQGCQTIYICRTTGPTILHTPIGMYFEHCLHFVKSASSNFFVWRLPLPESLFLDLTQFFPNPLPPVEHASKWCFLIKFGSWMSQS